jgi:OOP family OmpA-OmpF porin
MPGDETKTEPGSPPGPVEDARLRELRRIVAGPVADDLKRLRERVEDPVSRARDVGGVLPDAIKHSSTWGEKLGESLSPIVSGVIRASVRKDARELGEVLFPVMGPAIRKAIAESIRGTIQSFNQALENTLSVRGLKWRFEAWRTGRPFSEVVLLHSLVYRVEQVLLIHRKTGLLMQHVAAGEAVTQDADLVSRILTATRDFVRDSFGAGKGESRDAFRVGEFVVWVEQTADLVLALVIRGTPPEEVRVAQRETAESLQVRIGEAAVSYDGNQERFAAVRPDLAECLCAQYARGGGARVPVYTWAAVALVVLGLAAWILLIARDSARWRGFVARLRAEPGLVVASAGRNGSGFAVTGLRDPLARDPDSLLAGSGIKPGRVRQKWQSYNSTEPPFVTIRARRLLAPPEGVAVAAEGGRLILSGTVGHAWLAGAYAKFGYLSGVDTVVTDSLRDIDLSRLVAAVESAVVRFRLGRAGPTAGGRLELSRQSGRIREVLALAFAVGVVVQLEVVGHTDQANLHARNDTLSRDRALFVRDRLVADGVDSARVAAIGVATAEPLGDEATDDGRALNRSVTVRVHVTGVTTEPQQ